MKDNSQTLQAEGRCGLTSHLLQGHGSLGNSFPKLKAGAEDPLTQQQWNPEQASLAERAANPLPSSSRLRAPGPGFIETRLKDSSRVSRTQGTPWGIWASRIPARADPLLRAARLGFRGRVLLTCGSGHLEKDPEEQECPRDSGLGDGHSGPGGGRHVHELAGRPGGFRCVPKPEDAGRMRFWDTGGSRGCAERRESGGAGAGRYL